MKWERRDLGSAAARIQGWWGETLNTGFRCRPDSQFLSAIPLRFEPFAE